MKVLICFVVYLKLTLWRLKGMQTITWQQFYKSYRAIHEGVPSYRLGQHFCNLFIRDSDPTTCDPVVKGLWNKTGEEAFSQCFKIIEHYHWDVNELPLEREDLL